MEGGREGKWRFLVLASRVISANTGLGTHLSQWLVQCGSPWQEEEEEEERRIKKARLDQEIPREVVAACYRLLLRLPRLRQTWSWTGLFTLLPTPCLHTRFLAIELLRQLFFLSEVKSTRCQNFCVLSCFRSKCRGCVKVSWVQAPPPWWMN